MAIGDIHITADGPFIQTDQGPVLCNGQLISRRKNPELYALIGTCYTDEDRRCTTCDLFCVPDLMDP